MLFRSAAVGAVDKASLGFVCDYADHEGFVENLGQKGIDSYSFGDIQLTFLGWAYLDTLRQGKVDSRMAFMAMPFGNDELDTVYRDFLKPAVQETGFKLKRLDEAQPAGLIDDHLRTEIRQSRFLIVDLTTRNNGAYWEAGFAEGLGKPVIYTCRKDEFDKGDVHFDTNHHLTVIWEPSKMEEAVAKLKDTIRATFPGETN